jgi:putative transposase
VIDEYTRECLAILVQRRITSHDVLYPLSELFFEYGIRTMSAATTDLSPSLRRYAAGLPMWASPSCSSDPAAPGKNGSIGSFNGKLRDELLNGELLFTLKEAQILIEQRRREHNHLRPHNSLGGRPPAPETLVWPGFSLADYAPPTPTREPALALS